jgi:hypothetical protein
MAVVCSLISGCSKNTEIQETKPSIPDWAKKNPSRSELSNDLSVGGVPVRLNGPTASAILASPGEIRLYFSAEPESVNFNNDSHATVQLENITSGPIPMLRSTAMHYFSANLLQPVTPPVTAVFNITEANGNTQNTSLTISEITERMGDPHPLSLTGNTTGSLASDLDLEIARLDRAAKAGQTTMILTLAPVIVSGIEQFGIQAGEKTEALLSGGLSRLREITDKVKPESAAESAQKMIAEYQQGIKPTLVKQE